ncbi:hypothetical protein HanRHA438_Chr08g0351431 [Helianthus annuus]|nr:hypothetical protein HanRHA438_Chr08g0351431 [Helianthus annuus]
MADSNSQHHRTIAGGTETLIDHPGSPLNVVPHNLSPVFAFNEDEDALFKNRVVEDPEPISSEFPVMNQNATNDDEDGVQNCTFTQLLSTGHFCLCETMIFFL